MLLLSSAARSTVVAPRPACRAASAIALKYSRAVYGAALAKSPQTLTTVHNELAKVATSIQTNPDIHSFVNNPTLSANDRKAGLTSFFTQLEGPKKDTISDTTKNLLAVLSENGRLGETQGVIEGFNELVSQYRGELTVVVTSATALPKDILTRLETSLKQSQAGQKAKVLKITNKVCTTSPVTILSTLTAHSKVNPSVLGGIIVDFGDKTLDLSVQSRVTKLNNVLQRACLAPRSDFNPDNHLSFPESV